MAVRVATFNVENLFSRAKVLNFYNHSNGDTILERVAALQTELERQNYDKRRIVQLYRQVRNYIKFNVIRSRVGHRIIYKRRGVWRVAPDGRDDWFGYIEFKRDSFNDITQQNIARVIRDMNADVLCLVEVENRPVLDQFNSDRLSGRRRYSYSMLIDGNDPRGIDVGLYSRFELGVIKTNIFDRNNRGRRIFSRDCLEVEILLPSGQSLYVLLNHFKSKSGGEAATDSRRKAQAQYVARILTSEYDLQNDLVIVMGDLNDTPTRPPLPPLLSLQHLYDVLEEEFNDPADRWTYHYRRNEQIDYILVSEPLRRARTRTDVFRRGMANVDQYSNGAIQPYPQVTSWRNAASDHGAVWAEFNI
ncbi:endonuclease/exonuclease/phosphatase family protein [bacterium]|nr:endonuclease/exonuclease/phosphatase family protein [bacterium]